jgi:secreted effector protein SseB
MMSISVAPSASISPLEAVRPTPQSVANSQSMFSNGLQTMQNIMLQLTQSGNELFVQMNRKSEIARDAQDKANLVEGIMAKLEKPADKLELPDGAIAYMKANNILVDGKTIDEFIGVKGKTLDKGDLMMVKSSLESVAGRATDFNQQSQLKLQQIMQNYSTSNQLTQSMQSMLAEMTKGTASAIR